jgi:oligopeptidase A
MVNPLLELTSLPPFSEIKPSHVEVAVDRLLTESRKQLGEILSTKEPYGWDNLVVPIDEMEDRMQRAWSPVRHMNSVVNTPELREAYNACLPKLSAYHTEMGQNEDLFRAYTEIRNSEAFETLDKAQQKCIDDSLRNFHLSGIDLPSEKKESFKQIMQELTKLQSRYEENLLDATNAWYKQFDHQDALEGLPPSALDMTVDAARQRDLEGWVITLEFPSYYSVITYAEDRTLREEIYRAYVTRASDQGPNAGKWDNSEVMMKILDLRQEAAELLGYKSFAEKSLATKMAESPEQVLEFLQDLASRARPQAEKEMSELGNFAREHLGISELRPWDLAYAGEKLRQHAYQLSEEDLKPYFAVDNVIKGLFDLVGRLFGIQIEERSDVDTWHPDVRFFDIRDEQGNLRGQFYFDLYARQHKRGGAWMDECINRMHYGGKLQTPVAYMTCNSSPPAGGKPALFTHDEVTTLFHEFGHGLQHMLTTIDYPEVSGINGVEWDAVELPSQFMENWCWEKEALDLFARHYETGECMPDGLFERMKAARHFQTAMQMLRQIEFAMFDMRMHRDHELVKREGVQKLLDEVREEVSVVIPPDWNRFQHGFTHVFAGGYAAGYYSYKWAEVLSADAFSRFEEEGLFNEQVGRDFLHTVLELGGSRKAIEVYKSFRGREPNIEALLRHSGLAA